jgi:tRNA(adenine34) deaminase
MRGLWETLSAPWQASLEEAWAAYRAGSIPVGAAVTDHEGRVLTRAHNRTFERDGDLASFQASPLA